MADLARGRSSLLRSWWRGLAAGESRAGASDIHIEERAGDVRVRFRVDGLLREVLELPQAARWAVLSRIKVMAGMDISVRRRLQDSAIPFDWEDRRKRWAAPSAAVPVCGATLEAEWRFCTGYLRKA